MTLFATLCIASTAQARLPGDFPGYFVPAVVAPSTCAGTTYYVGGSGASDSNAGTSSGAPWATLNKVNTKSPAFHGGDCIKQQANLTGPTSGQAGLTLSSSNVTSASNVNPVTFDCQGFTITGGHGGVGVSVVHLDGANGFKVQNCTIRPGTSGGGGATQYIVLTENGAVGTITGNDIGGAGFSANNNDQAAGIQLSGGNTTVSNNTVHGLSGVGSSDDHGIHMNAYSSDQLVTGNTVYNIGGRNASHGVGPGYSGNGIGIGWPGTPCGPPSGTCTITIEHNLIHHTGGNNDQCGGPSGILAYEVYDTLIIRYNEVHHIQPISNSQSGCDWDGIDLDGGVTKGIVEYNYTHDNGGAGLLAWMGGGGDNPSWGPNTYRFNISENDGTLIGFSLGSDGGWGNFTISNTGASPTPTIYVYNNTVYGGVFSAWSFSGDTTSLVSTSSIFANNLTYQTSDHPFMVCNSNGRNWNATGYGFRFEANGWYTTHTAQWGSHDQCSDRATLSDWQTLVLGNDTGATSANPVLTGTLPVGSCTWTPGALSGPRPCPAGYALTGSSTAYRNTGMNVSSLVSGVSGASMGTEDYYGSALPSGTGTGYPIGAGR